MLERFEDYYDPERPKLDKITFIPIPEPEPLAAAIEAGDIQLIGGNPARGGTGRPFRGESGPCRLGDHRAGLPELCG